MSSTDDLDVVALVADKNMKAALDCLLEAPQRLVGRTVRKEVIVHPGRDPGVYRKCEAFLRPWLRRARHALVVFDLEGSGAKRSGNEVEAEVENRLSANGWEKRAAAICIVPELEAWVWAPNLDASLQGSSKRSSVQWLRDQGFLFGECGKPKRPKEAFEALLRPTPRSSAIYTQLAGTLDFRDCADPAFLKLRSTLTGWFGASSQPAC